MKTLKSLPIELTWQYVNVHQYMEENSFYEPLNTIVEAMEKYGFDGIIDFILESDVEPNKPDGVMHLSNNTGAKIWMCTNGEDVGLVEFGDTYYLCELEYSTYEELGQDVPNNEEDEAVPFLRCYDEDLKEDVLDVPLNMVITTDM